MKNNNENKNRNRNKSDKKVEPWFVGSVLMSLGFIVLVCFSLAIEMDMKGPIAMYALFLAGDRGTNFFDESQGKTMRYLNLLMAIGGVIIAIGNFVEILRG